MLRTTLRRLMLVVLVLAGLGAASLASAMAPAPALHVALLDPLNLSAVARAQEKQLVWERFDVDITVNSDGTFTVCEEQAIRFTDGSFSFGYRSLPFNNLSNITNWSVTDDQGRTYALNQSREPGTFIVEEGSQYELYWYFEPKQNESGAWTLCYTVEGGIRYYEEGDQLWWKAVYSDRPYPVQASRVTVNLPLGASV
ncbi:MAG: DUF2207 domain-containing protein, partial [Caldilineaceae bacterium]